MLLAYYLHITTNHYVLSANKFMYFLQLTHIIYLQGES